LGPVFLPRSVLARTAAAAAFPCWFFRGFLFVFAFLCLYFCVCLSPLAFCGGPFGCVDGPHTRGGDAPPVGSARRTGDGADPLGRCADDRGAPRPGVPGRGGSARGGAGRHASADARRRAGGRDPLYAPRRVRRLCRSARAASHGGAPGPSLIAVHPDRLSWRCARAVSHDGAPGPSLVAVRPGFLSPSFSFGPLRSAPARKRVPLYPPHGRPASGRRKLRPPAFLRAAPHVCRETVCGAVLTRGENVLQ
jgi:hypothetical protein